MDIRITYCGACKCQARAASLAAEREQRQVAHAPRGYHRPCAFGAAMPAQRCSALPFLDRHP
jgi:hypothetical protein